MAATFYSQILHTYAWDRIASDLDGAIAAFREVSALAESPDKPPFVEYGYAAAELIDGDTIEARFYLGSVMNDTPSGKLYTPWTTNVTATEVDRDLAWWAALEHAASRVGAYIDSGTGDPEDIYICKRDQLDPVGQAMYEADTREEGAR